MNMNQVINMIVRIVMRKAINSGVNAGINALSGSRRGHQRHAASGTDQVGNMPEEGRRQVTQQDKLHQQQARETARRAKQMARVGRRITKI